MSRCHCPATSAGTVRGSCHYASLYSLDLSILPKGCYQRGSPRSGSGSAPAAGGCDDGYPRWHSLWREQVTCVIHTLSPRRREGRSQEAESVSITPVPTSFSQSTPSCPPPALGRASLFFFPTSILLLLLSFLVPPYLLPSSLWLLALLLPSL